LIEVRFPRIYLQIDMNVYIDICMIFMYTYICIYVYADICMYVYIYMYIYTYIHTCLYIRVMSHMCHICILSICTLELWTYVSHVCHIRVWNMSHMCFDRVIHVL